jgi:hypothetical protein
MSDVMLPPGLKIANIEWRYLESGGNTARPYTGAVRTRNLGGDKLACSIEFTIAKDADRAALISFVGSLRGQTNRPMIIDPSHEPRGSWVSVCGAELLTNSEFSGTTGFSTSSATLSASNGVLGIGNALSGTNISSNSVSTTHGYKVVSIVTDSTTLTAYLMLIQATSGYTAGAYALLHFASLARCFLADGPANLLLQSDALNTGANWTPSGCTVGANSAVAPDGTMTAESIVESNSSNVEHYIQQTVTGLASAAADFTFNVAIAPNSRSWAVIRLIENTGSTAAYVFINLTTGVLGSSAVGANWSNIRAKIAPFGTFFHISLTARKTNAATSISALIQSATADSSFSYAGSAATDAIRIWRPTLNGSSVPTRLMQTTSAAVPASTQKGTGFYVKGLPASQSGLLLAGDWVEFLAGTRCFKRMLTAALNTDAVGLGYLQVSPPVPFDVSDNAPIMVCRPVSRMVCTSAPPTWMTEPGLFSRVSLEFVESGD